MIYIPQKIKSIVGGQKPGTDSVGMSRARVLLYEKMVLKVEEESEETVHEAQALGWLQGRLPVPKVICHESHEKMSYLLMSRLPGTMACDKLLMGDPERLTAILARGLEMLWQVQTQDCPFDSGLDRKLEMARYQVEHDLVDVDDAEPATFGEGRFRDPRELLAWLEQNRPEEDPVFSHGDYCLPNLFVEDGRISGFIDLGKAGIADRYQDIALCYRSLEHNYRGKYRSGKGVGGFCPDRLFAHLGIEPDREKIRYYILLDELF